MGKVGGTRRSGRVIAAVLCGAPAADLMMAGLYGPEVRQLLKAAADTFLRVNLALLLAQHGLSLPVWRSA